MIKIRVNFFMEKGLKGTQITISCLVIENFIWIKSLFKCHLSYKATFSLSQTDSKVTS